MISGIIGQGHRKLMTVTFFVITWTNDFNIFGIIWT